MELSVRFCSFAILMDTGRSLSVMALQHSARPQIPRPADDARLVPHPDLAELDAHLEDRDEVLDQLAEVDAVLSREEEEDLLLVQEVVGAHELHSRARAPRPSHGRSRRPSPPACRSPRSGGGRAGPRDAGWSAARSSPPRGRFPCPAPCRARCRSGWEPPRCPRPRPRGPAGASQNSVALEYRTFTRQTTLPSMVTGGAPPPAASAVSSGKESSVMISSCSSPMRTSLFRALVRKPGPREAR